MKNDIATMIIGLRNAAENPENFDIPGTLEEAAKLLETLARPTPAFQQVLGHFLHDCGEILGEPFPW